MLKDIKLMMDFVKETSSIIYGKEVFFYEYKTDKWYSRDHSRSVEFSEIIEWLKDRIYPYIIESDDVDENLDVHEECLDCYYYENGECDGDEICNKKYK